MSIYKRVFLVYEASKRARLARLARLARQGRQGKSDLVTRLSHTVVNDSSNGC